MGARPVPANIAKKRIKCEGNAHSCQGTGKMSDQDAGNGRADEASQLDDAHHDGIASLQVLFIHQHWNDAVFGRNGETGNDAEERAKQVNHPTFFSRRKNVLMLFRGLNALNISFGSSGSGVVRRHLRGDYQRTLRLVP
jgi:hypothetical protein